MLVSAITLDGEVGAASRREAAVLTRGVGGLGAGSAAQRAPGGSGPVARASRWSS